MSNYKSSIIIGWKVAMILLGGIGLISATVKISGFWSSYVLDIVGPAWNYILIRGIYNSRNKNFLFTRFSPESALLFIIVICFLIETSQYFKLYKSHYDPYDYLAYVSLLLPIYFIDKHFSTT